MNKRLTRRQALQLGLLGGVAAACSPAAPPSAGTDAIQRVSPAAPTPLPSTTPPLPGGTDTPPRVSTATAPAPTSAPARAPTAELAADMARAADAFLQSLSADQRAQAVYAFDDAERVRWHWTTPGNFPRNGLPLTRLTPAQRTAAFALLQAGVSPAGYQKALDIMSLQRDLGNDPELYFVTLFGAPGEGAWGWRWEGHHLSRQYTLVGEQIAVTPFFLGAWPTLTEAGLRAMPREEDAALALAASAGPAAIFQAAPLTRHVTQNAPEVAPLDPVGVAYGALTAEAQALAREILETYLSGLPEPLAAAHLERLTAAGLEAIRFGWAGPLELRRPTYYRLQGPTFLLEHDKSRNGGTHIHSVWRDFEQDFGRHLL